MPLFKDLISASYEAKQVTLYQVPLANKAGFMENMMGRFVPVDNLEAVYSTIKQVENGDIEALLDECFFEFNGDEKANAFLNYSMSVGDVLVVGNDAYRCTMKGWSKI